MQGFSAGKPRPVMPFCFAIVDDVRARLVLGRGSRSAISNIMLCRSWNISPKILSR